MSECYGFERKKIEIFPERDIPLQEFEREVVIMGFERKKEQLGFEDAFCRG